MRFIVLMMALFAMLMGANLKWSSDYDAALKEAKKEKKDVYLFLGSEYCKYCEKFKEEVLVRKDVEAKLKKKYVLLYLSRDIDDIPAHLETKPVPRHYFLKSDGKIIYTTIGGRSLEGFEEMLADVDEAKKD